MISLVQNLNLNSLDEFGLGLDKSVKDLIFSNSVLGNQVYIGLFSVIASLFVANQENKVENFLVYVSLTLPTSLILFNMMKSMNILGLF